MQSSFTFVKHEHNLKEGNASFFYQLIHEEKTYEFKETLSFIPSTIKSVSNDLINHTLDNVLLMLGVSYWKLTCSPIIYTPTITLTQAQAIFWDTLYTKGLGEFFYKNNLDFKGLIHFPYEENHTIAPLISHQQNRSLLFFGGGKDSIVSSELLKKANKDFSIFVINPTRIQEETAAQTGKEILSVQRHLDPQLFELNTQAGFYNGHVPATAIIDFIGLFAATVYDYTYIIASNEHSANYGNVEYLGEEINHQWSKSYEFEVLLQNYIASSITSSITYFSLLRPLYEIKITEIFSKLDQYFPYFSSCNRNFTLHNKLTGTRWCGECPKCLFVFILLSAYIPKDTVLTIFNKDLYDDYALLQTLRELLGIDGTKPFECVGTPDETKLALLHAYQTGEYRNDILMGYFIQEILPTIVDPTSLEKRLLNQTLEHTIPKEFSKIYET